MPEVRPSDLSDTSANSEFAPEELFNTGYYAPMIKALATTLLIICIAILTYYTWLEGRPNFSVPWLILPVLVLVLGLIKTGHLIAGTRVLHWGMVLAALIGSYGVTGVSTPTLYLLPVLTMSTLLLIGRLEAVAMFTVVILSVSWQIYIQTHGWIPPIGARPPEYYFLAIFSVMITALLLGNAAARNLISQYLKVKTTNQALMDNQAQLVKEIADRKEAETHLHHSEERLRLVMEGAELGFWDWDITAGSVERNKRWAEMLGYTYDEIKNTTQQWTDFIYPDDRERAWTSIKDVLEGRAASHKAEYRMLHKDGSVRWILDQAKIMRRDENGKPTRMSGTHTDITDRKLLEALNSENNQRLNTILNNIFTYVALLDTNGTVQEVNNAPLERAGYRREDVIGKYFYDAPWWNYDDKVRAQLIEAINAARQGETSRYDVTVKMGDDLVTIDFQIAPVRDSSGQVIGMLPTAVDITERKTLEDKLNMQAHLDYLTGLDNRRSFMEKGEIELSRAHRYDTALSVLMLDIDMFKHINDTYGHQIGDLVLKTLAMIFQAVLRNVDTVGRLGGEEFGVVLPETGMEEAIEVAERLREVISTTEVALPVGIPVHFTVSIGVASLTKKNTNIDTLLNEADKALYLAKESGRNRVCT